LKEARQTRQDLEAELQDIVRIQGEEREDDNRDQGRKRRRANTRGERLQSLDNLSQDLDITDYIPVQQRPVPKMRDLPIYKGKSVQEAQAFIAGAERRFRQDKGYLYNTDTEKIDACVLAFDTMPEQRWAGYEEEVGVGNTTWEEFKEFLLESIKDKDNRLLDATNKYEAA